MPAEQSSTNELELLIAKKINDMPKSVISRSHKDLVWRNSEPIVVRDNESFVREIQALINTAGTISVESGLTMWQLFIRNALFEDIWVFLHPAVASQGEKLFDAADRQINLQLTSSKTYSNGVIGLYYRHESE